VKISKS